MTNISPINLFSGHLSYDCVDNEGKKMLISDCTTCNRINKKPYAIIPRISGLVISLEPLAFDKKNPRLGMRGHIIAGIPQ